ncbi:50S ribosomal protein L21 [candidate division BRC1 bacterium HGW-BRC1-1]|jgi:large subunit ribosomal protein L21|nr:MAG: 50S ribosomal protein L21 [candidate division BRC1 bacterium HGW-BRC1-1]
MYAIFRAGGRQFRVNNGDVVRMPLMDAEVGSEVEMNDVLQLTDDNGPKLGTPLIAGAKVTAKILRHGKEKKILVYTFKRRKGYEKRRGHRQDFTEVRIEKIEG